MHNRRDLALVVGLLVVVLALGLLTSPDEDAAAFDLRASTFRSAPPGALALYLALETLDVPVARRVTDWVDGDPLDGTLVLLSPAQPLTPLEVDTLLAWVEAGGSLLAGAGWFQESALFEELGLSLVRLDPAPQPALPQATHGWTEDTRPVEGFRWGFHAESAALTSGDAMTILASARGRHPVVVTLPFGDGQVMAWSDVRPLTNAALRDSGAALVFARAAADLAAGRGPLVFDEYHHGYRDDVGPARALGQFILYTPPGWMVLQWGVVVLGLLYLHGRRFGSPHLPAPARRRSPLEHVDALAGAYRQGGARATARRLVVTGLARRLGHPVPAPGAEDDWMRQLTARAAGDTRLAEALHHEWQRGADADLVTLARHADAVAQEQLEAPPAHAGRRVPS